MIELAMSPFGNFMIFIALLIIGGFWLVQKNNSKDDGSEMRRLKEELDRYKKEDTNRSVDS